MHYINMSSSNTAAQTYVPDKKTHDHVNHLGFCISDWTKRFKSHDLYQHVQYKLRSAELPNKKKKHDLVNHLGLRICDWTKRFKPQQHVCIEIDDYILSARCSGCLFCCKQCCCCRPLQEQDLFL